MADNESEQTTPKQPTSKKATADDETVSDEKKCPECGAPVNNLRATCPNCGHEYSEEDYDNPEAGSEFRTGSELEDDEKGERVRQSEAQAGGGERQES